MAVNGELGLFKAGDGVRLTVVGPIAAVGLNGDLVLLGTVSDGQGTGLVAYAVVLGPGIGLKGVSCDGVVAGADDGPGAFNGHAGETLLTDEGATGDRVAAVGERIIVEFLGVGSGGQLDGDGINGQRAVFVFDFIISGEGAAVILDGRCINYVGLLTRVGDGGGSSHGEGNFVFGIAVDQTGGGKAGVGQRRAVICPAAAVRLQSQGYGVVDSDHVAGSTNGNRGCGREAFGNRICIVCIQTSTLTCTQWRADSGGSGFIAGNRNSGTIKVVVDGVARLIELEVQLQDEGAVAGDGAGFDIGSGGVEGILAAVFIRLVGVGNGGGVISDTSADIKIIGGNGVFAVSSLVVELDLVLRVGVRRPDGVEVV